MHANSSCLQMTYQKKKKIKRAEKEKRDYIIPFVHTNTQTHRGRENMMIFHTSCNLFSMVLFTFNALYDENIHRESLT